MDSETKSKVVEKVREILGKADMDTATEQKVREMAAESLSVDLCDVDFKKLVSEVVEEFLLSTFDDDDRARVYGEGLHSKENTNTSTNTNLVGEGNARVLESNLNLNGEIKESGEQPTDASECDTGGEAPGNKNGSDGIRFLCKLSNNRSVAIKETANEKVVLVGEFNQKDGKQVPGSRGISLTAEQWFAFRKSFPEIEEAIKKVKSQLRSPVGQKQIEGNDKPDSHGPVLKKQKKDVVSDPRTLNPIEIIRFDGKNYHDWARRIEIFLKQLNLAYVLTNPCPTSVEANTREIPQVLDNAQKWMDDDYMCRTNILSSLSDDLFYAYSKKAGSAKELWDELKLLYLTEEHGSKVSLVKKYMEFQMVEGKSVVAQTQELHELADSLNPHGMHVEECFHVNAIISKLPASWKDVGVKLMRENNLPVWFLMNSLKQEEELRRKGKRGASTSLTDDPEPDTRGRLCFQPNYNNRLGGLLQNIAPDRERKVLLCTICKRKGHLEEKCWFNKNNKYERGKNSNGGAEFEEGAPK